MSTYMLCSDSLFWKEAFIPRQLTSPFYLAKRIDTKRSAEQKGSQLMEQKSWRSEKIRSG